MDLTHATVTYDIVLPIYSWPDQRIRTIGADDKNEYLKVGDNITEDLNVGGDLRVRARVCVVFCHLSADLIIEILLQLRLG